MINNSNVIESTYVCEMGLFAEDPDDGEILYGYTSADNYGDYIAPATSGPYSWNYQIIAAVGNASNVTVELSNLTYDYGVISTNTTLFYLAGGNQKEINKSIDNLFRTYLTSNSGNIYTITTSNITALSLKDGFPLSLKINANSSGAASIKINSLNAILLKKANGSDVKLYKDGIYSFKYNETTKNFMLQGEGGGGDAIAAQLLINKKANVDAGDIVGTMPDNGPLNAQLPINGIYEIPAGYTQGGKVTQSIPTKTAATITPSTVDQVIAAGQYIQEPQIIKGDPNLIPANIPLNKTIFGVTGTTEMFKHEIISSSYKPDGLGHGVQMAFQLLGTPVVIIFAGCIMLINHNRIIMEHPTLQTSADVATGSDGMSTYRASFNQPMNENYISYDERTKIFTLDCWLPLGDPFQIEYYYLPN
jgi:hypothetical protein